MPGGRPRTIYVGKRSGALVLLSIDGRNERGNLILSCKCDCGRTVQMTNVSFAVRVRCKECSHVSGALKRTKHGGSKRGQRNRLYSSYKAMLTRCYNPKSRNFRWYGAKGIGVCEQWRNDFGTFREWALANGYHDGLTLDRKKSHLDYSPENCGYVTQSENSRRMQANYVLVPKSLATAIFYNEPNFGDF